MPKIPSKRSGRPRKALTPTAAGAGGGAITVTSIPSLAAAPPAKLEFRATDDDAWYSVHLKLESQTLRVMYYEFPASQDERFDADSFTSAAAIEVFGRRFRLDSVPCEDCREVREGMRVCAFHEFAENDKHFYDAVVEKVSRADGDGKCSCSFELMWEHGPLGMHKTSAKIDSISIIQPGGPQVDATLKYFIDIAREEVNLRISKAELFPESLRNGGESILRHGVEAMSLNNVPFNEAMSPKTDVKHTPRAESKYDSEKESQDFDMGSTMKKKKFRSESECYYFFRIVNIEKDITPGCIMDFIHEHTLVSSVAVVLPALSSEFFSTGTIFVDTKEKAVKLSEFLFSPSHIIISFRGRPWVVNQKWHGSLEGKMPKYEGQSERRRDYIGRIKLVSVDTKEYTKGLEVLNVNKEYYEHLEILCEELEKETNSLPTSAPII